MAGPTAVLTKEAAQKIRRMQEENSTLVKANELTLKQKQNLEA